MARITKEPARGISKKDRKAKIKKMGYGLKENQQTGELYTVKK